MRKLVLIVMLIYKCFTRKHESHIYRGFAGTSNLVLYYVYFVVIFLRFSSYLFQGSDAIVVNIIKIFVKRNN